MEENKPPADLFLAFKKKLGDKWQKRNEFYLKKLAIKKAKTMKENSSEIHKQADVVNLMTKASK